jgi:superfamily II DNA or RNA helicase
MKLIIGNTVSDEDWDSIKSGATLQDISAVLMQQLIEILQSSDRGRIGYSFDLLCWMVATGTLEIRFAIKPGGMYHEKIGILENAAGEKLVFQGSANESSNALLPTKNFESIAVYPSWKEEIFTAYATPFCEGFERLWNNSETDVITIDVPSEFYEKIHKKRSTQMPPDLDLERDLIESAAEAMKSVKDKPRVPKTIGGQRYSLRSHQEVALRSWASNDYRGIFELATGAGKTITVLHAAARFYERDFPTFLVIAVPYIVLAEQWCNVMASFNMHPVQAWGGVERWQNEMNNRITEFRLQARRFCSVVVVNDTLSTTRFQQLLRDVPASSMFFVGDECHHHGTEAVSPLIPRDARYLAGLSATPWNPRELRRRQLLTDTYGGVCATYTLRDALNDGVLCQYKYTVTFVPIDDDERDEYVSLTQKLGALQAQYKEKRDSDIKLRLQTIAGQRSRLVGSFRGKYAALIPTLTRARLTVKRALFYAGEGGHPLDNDGDADARNIDTVTSELAGTGVRVSRVTAAESNNERLRILDAFLDGAIDAIAAIRVLDEGFDIPGCRAAFLLASSNSQRQYIQRRGRVLRPDNAKTHAEIHDFIALPSLDAYRGSPGVWRKYIASELSRAREFFDMAMNSSELAGVYKELENYDGADVIFASLDSYDTDDTDNE